LASKKLALHKIPYFLQTIASHPSSPSPENHATKSNRDEPCNVITMKDET
jgi:hypothetical protein